MEVIEGMRHLLQMEEIDGQIAAADAALAAMAEERAGLAREEGEAEEAVSAARQVLEAQDRELRGLESQIQDQDTLLDRLNERSSQVVSKQAYDALVHETDDARESKSVLETRALEVMEAVDEAGSALADAETAQSELASRATERRADIGVLEEREQADGSASSERRIKQVERTDSKLLARYERVGLRRRPVVVVLVATSCPACHIVVPPQRLIEIRRADEIYACSGCLRLLLPGHVFDD